MGDNEKSISSTQSSGKGMAITAFVISLFGLIPFVGTVISLIAIILAIIVLAKGKNGKGFAIAGLIIGLILLILQVFVVLAVIGLYFSASTIMASNAVVSAPFMVSGFILTENQVIFELKNVGAEDLDAVSVSVSINDPSEVICTSSNPTSMTYGSTSIHTLSCSGINSGEYVSGDITVSYSNDAGISKSASGTLSGKAL